MRAITGTVFVVLLATSGSYGYHRDELYFRVLGHHLGWGYIDQPPLTPLLGRISTAVFGDHLWALRLPSMLAIAATAVLLALIARELGGDAIAQSLAALGVATNFALVDGHLLLTTSFDAVIWVGVLLCILRALIRQRDEWWLAAGVVTGIGLYNKHLIVLLLLTVGIGLLHRGATARLCQPHPVARRTDRARRRRAESHLPSDPWLAAVRHGQRPRRTQRT